MMKMFRRIYVFRSGELELLDDTAIIELTPINLTSPTQKVVLTIVCESTHNVCAKFERIYPRNVADKTICANMIDHCAADLLEDDYLD